MKNLLLILLHSLSHTDSTTSIPLFKSCSKPPEAIWLGSLVPITTFEKTFGSIISEHGPLFPVWAQGSRVTYRVAFSISLFILSMATDSAWGAPKDL